MVEFPSDIYTEPEPSIDTLAHLGPLRGMAGTWQGLKGTDVHPVAEGTETDRFVEHYDLQPIDAQTNGPQCFYGLRYHTHIVKPGETETFHDQVGYWLWEPATGNVFLTLSIPRGQVAMAVGRAASTDTAFELAAGEGVDGTGIVSNPFLQYAFRTVSFRMTVTVGADTWSYDEDTVLLPADRAEPFHHTDANTLVRVGPPVPNPLAAEAAREAAARSAAPGAGAAGTG